MFGAFSLLLSEPVWRSLAFLDCLYPDVDPGLIGGHVAIGNFDGMHRGHQAVIEALRAQADGGPALVLTFEPHPRDFFGRGEPVFRLTPPPIRAEIAAALGLDGVVTLPFTADFAALTAEDFINEVLVKALKVRSVSVGWNFHFGKGRAGNAALLEQAGERLGFAVSRAEAFCDEGGVVLSSSRIRNLLSAGAMGEAARLLGWRWLFDGVIVHGDKRGRTIGFPTANIRLPTSTGLSHGIYAVLVDIDGMRHHGVASYGRRPTFDNGAPVFESFVFDFAGDLYGKTVRVTPVSWLRAEAKFDSVEALVAQMNRDADEARQLLMHLEAGSLLDQALAPK